MSVSRRYNFTGRIRIGRLDAAVTMHAGEDAFRFSADINLERYPLPGDAFVIVEAYRQTQIARFQFGTVSDVVQPPENERRLDDTFSTPDGVLFRVKVVKPESGLLLGHADSINPRREFRNESLLPVVPAELGQESWRVNFEGDPIFQINRDIAPDWRTASQSPEFRGLVYPAVLREILNRILLVEGYEGYSDTDEQDEWQARWLRLAAEDFGAGTPPSVEDGEDKIDNWISNAVAGFSRRVRAFRSYNGVTDDN